MVFSRDKAVGGYQELELPLDKENLYRATISTNSARSAIKLVLSSIGPKKVWLPAYICDSVVEAANDVGVTIGFYRINSDFEIDPTLTLNEDELILIVDYFGLCGETVSRSISRFGQNQTIVDCSQAYFAPPVDSLATIYSPRKFFGLPDGGLLHSTDPRIQKPAQRDTSSESRMKHLISRLTNRPEVAYQQYLAAERAISELPVEGMSHLTERLLQAVDYARARTARAGNALYLHERLGEYNQLYLKIDERVAPLCYPLLPNVETVSKADLLSQRVFVPTYWPEVLERVEKGSFEWNLVTNGLFMPCDQRYNEDDMNRLVRLLAIT